MPHLGTLHRPPQSAQQSQHRPSIAIRMLDGRVDDVGLVPVAVAGWLGER